MSARASAPLRRMRRGASWISGAWMALTLATILVRVPYNLTEEAGPPWLRVPWGRATRFFETPEGLVHVWACTFERVEVYDTAGRFVRSHRVPAHLGCAEWAVSERGRIFTRHWPGHSSTDIVREMDSRLNVIQESRFNRGIRIALGEEGHAVVHQAPLTGARGDGEVPARAADPGELLFGESAAGIFEGPDEFTAQDGSVLRRAAIGLVRTSPDGRHVRILCAPALLPFALPLPGLLAFVVALIPLAPGLRSHDVQERARARGVLLASCGVGVFLATLPLFLVTSGLLYAIGLCTVSMQLIRMGTRQARAG